MAEPRWRLLLCWGTVITFLTMPMIVLVLAITSRIYGWLGVEEHLKGYKFLGTFFQSVTALVFGLSGLRSLDKYVETKNGNGNKKPPS
jgi:fumarate reductase subunit D